MKLARFVAVLIVLVGAVDAVSSAPRPDSRAALDPRASAIVGETVTIRSRFAGKPVVEPHVSAHPADPDHLLVAAMVVTDPGAPYQSCRLSSFVSKDGGRSWSETAHDWWGYDPWTAILDSGETVLAWLGTPGKFEGRFPVRFFTSRDGGSTWGRDVQTLEGGHDGTKLAARGREMYFTTVRFRGGGGADVVLYRKEAGKPFEHAARIDGKGARLNFCEPAVLTDGGVILPASHFLRDAWVHEYSSADGSLSSERQVTTNPGGGYGYMRLVADTSAGSPHKDRLYFVRAAGRDASARGVWLNSSADRGKTWSADRRVDRFASASPSRALVASAAVNRDGVLAISWVDAQLDPKQRWLLDLFVALSLDGGASFQRPVRVTSTSSDPRTETNADVANKFPGGGHYLGLAARADGSFQLVWSDSRSGHFELQTCRVSVKRIGD